MIPYLEELERRDCPSSLQLVGGNLLYLAPTMGGSLVVDTTATGIAVKYDGQVATFTTGQVTRIIAQGAQGDDVLVNNTALPSVLQGGDGNDFLSGGSGNDILIGGAGNDTMYDIVGTNYHDGGAGADKVIASGRDTIIPDANDTTAVFQTRPLVQLTGGVLYLTGNEQAIVTESGNTLFVDVFSTATGSAHFEFQKGDINFIAGTGTAGDDLFINNSSKDSVYYGGNGNDVLIGGTGNDLLKGGNGDDTLVGGGGKDILFGNPGRDLLIGTGLHFFDADDVVTTRSPTRAH